jgi:hypothetical protein
MVQQFIACKICLAKVLLSWAPTVQAALKSQTWLAEAQTQY